MALAQWEKEQALKHADNSEVKYFNLISGPEVENNVETYDATPYDCTHQVEENHVNVAVPTLLSLTLQSFYKSEINKILEDIGSDKNCSDVKVTENQKELVIEVKQIEEEMFEAKIEQNINERKMDIVEKRDKYKESTNNKAKSLQETGAGIFS